MAVHVLVIIGKTKCIVKDCKSHTDLLRMWKNEVCFVHGKEHAFCPCVPPKGYRMFYVQTKSANEQDIWKRNLELKLDLWTRNTPVCSLHFIDDCPSQEHPYPILHSDQVSKAKRHLPPSMENNEEACNRMRQDSGSSSSNFLSDKAVIKTLEDKVQDHKKLLDSKNEQLESAIDEAKFSCFNVLANPNIFRFYTGISPELFTALYESILPYIENLHFWMGSQNSTNEAEAGVEKKLGKQDQFFLWLIKCRLNLKFQDLAFWFNISVSNVSCIFATWTQLLQPLLEKFIIWPAKEVITMNLPEKFREFPNTRAIVDCFELQIQHPKSLKAQAETFSNYKSRNTTKYSVAITPNKACSFVSKGFGGRTSDKKITAESGIIEYFESGDDCMADRGFDIEDLLKTKGVTLNAPPRRNGKE